MVSGLRISRSRISLPTQKSQSLGLSSNQIYRNRYPPDVQEDWTSDKEARFEVALQIGDSFIFMQYYARPHINVVTSYDNEVTSSRHTIPQNNFGTSYRDVPDDNFVNLQHLSAAIVEEQVYIQQQRVYNLISSMRDSKTRYRNLLKKY